MPVFLAADEIGFVIGRERNFQIVIREKERFVVKHHSVHCVYRLDAKACQGIDFVSHKGRGCEIGIAQEGKLGAGALL